MNLDTNDTGIVLITNKKFCRIEVSIHADSGG